MRERIVECARRFIGTPFRHQGRVAGVGVDCVGLVIGVARELSLVRVDERPWAGYGREPGPGTLKEALRAHLHEICPQDAKDGDVLLIRFGRDEQHVAILGPGGQSMIHAYESVGRCVEHRLDDRWRGRISAAFTWPVLVEVG